MEDPILKALFVNFFSLIEPSPLAFQEPSPLIVERGLRRKGKK